VDLREAQRPLKARYRESPAAARITLQARGSESASAVACSVAHSSSTSAHVGT